jgi:hypothetical protein
LHRLNNLKTTKQIRSSVVQAIQHVKIADEFMNDFMLIAESYEDVAEKLNLTLIKEQ